MRTAAAPAGKTQAKLPAGSLRWLIVPSLAFYLLVFVAPMLNVVRQSFTDSSALSLTNYARMFSDPFYVTVLVRTVRIGLEVTLIALILGYPCALYLSQAERKGRAIVLFIVLAPLLVSAVVRSYGWLIILGPSGILTRALAWTGLPRPQLLFTEAGVVIALAHVFLPFVVLAILGSLQSIDPSLGRAARILGARRLAVFLRVYLPLSVPGIAAGSLIVFSLSSSAFVTPALIGGSRVPVMSYLVYREGLMTLNFPFGSAVAIVLLLTTAVVAVLYTSSLGRLRSMRRGLE